jgi:hypothetical protein
MNKSKIIALAIATILTNSTMASNVSPFIKRAVDQIAHDDVIQRSASTVSVKDLPKSYVMASNAVDPAELVVFYQPSYAKEYGEQEIFKRVQAWIDNNNEIYKAHGFDNYNVKIVDFVPVQSVPDGLSFYSEYDLDGIRVTRGAGSLFTGAVLNSVLDDKGTPSPEYHIYQDKWKADFNLYVRALEDDGVSVRALGHAAIDSDSHVVFDTDNHNPMRTYAHELGHNLSMDHESSPSPYAPEYARASKCGNGKTIMYSKRLATEVELNHFSSPDFNYDGEACGVAGVAENARVIANYFEPATQRREGVQSLGTVYFGADSYTGEEATGINITLVRDGDVSLKASVKVFTEDGTATFKKDYTDAFFTAEFAAGETTTNVTLPLIEDVDDEGTESLTLSLKYPYRLSLGATAQVQAYITETALDGVSGTFSITSGDITLTEGEYSDITITRTNGVGDAVLSLTTVGNTAYSPSDFTLLNETLIFNAGETSKTVRFQTSEDFTPEFQENLQISISSTSASATFETKNIDVIIIDDDIYDYVAQGTFEVVLTGTTDTEMTVVENATQVDFTINRIGGSVGEVLLRVYTVDGEQVSGKDFTGVDEIVSFADGQATGNYRVMITDDSVTEEDGSFYIHIESPGAKIDSGSILKVNIKDNDTAPVVTPNKPSAESEESSGGSFAYLLLPLLAMSFRRKKLLLAE